jgi:hypothetical protein
MIMADGFLFDDGGQLKEKLNHENEGSPIWLLIIVIKYL